MTLNCQMTLVLELDAFIFLAKVCKIISTLFSSLQVKSSVIPIEWIALSTSFLPFTELNTTLLQTWFLGRINYVPFRVIDVDSELVLAHS